MITVGGEVKESYLEEATRKNKLGSHGLKAVSHLPLGILILFRLSSPNMLFCDRWLNGENRCW